MSGKGVEAEPSQQRSPVGRKIGRPFHESLLEEKLKRFKARQKKGQLNRPQMAAP
jgi:hypothetical protein